MSAYTDCLEEATFTQGDPVVYQRPTSIHHWQLRDLISAADNEQEFYCVHDTCVYSFNTDTKQSKLVTNLGWSANSMTCRAGFLAAGGLHGELEVRQLSTGEACFKGSVGSTVNNALHIAQHSSGEVRLFVCCNDNSIKVYALPSMDAVTVIRCPCPINYAALSPDGQHLVAVGDCNPTLLYQATPTAEPSASPLLCCAMCSALLTVLPTLPLKHASPVDSCRTSSCTAAAAAAAAAATAAAAAAVLEVRQLSTGEACFKGSVGSTVNNALHIAQHSSGEVRLFVCCNDNSIKVYALPSMDAVTVIRCPCPINYAALSPDGQHLVAVGDCNPTLLYQATPTGYASSTSFTEASDVGMCCAWNHHGTSFAACAQDGTVAVWDARSGACASRCLLPSAARCVKWAAPPLDLLAVAEHEARISLLDARRWGSGQALALGGAVRGAVRGGAGLRSLDVSGIAFSPSGRRLWVGLEPCCVGFSIDSLKRRTFGVADML
uniref:DUF2415 domain-containing protein n=1 Tax=Tetradesmus obliquus TaxID=3088 RepID=A0A383WEJ8_TETOB|eukprot:jgi/Sobl393_1/9285/SZX75851.1